MSAKRGKLIVLEGLDRSGKSTQWNLLIKRLEAEGEKVRGLRFPDRTTPIGKMIDAYLKGEQEVEDHVVHLLFSANRWELAPSIISDLNSGITLILDRYYHSGIIYSLAKHNPSLTLPWARAPDVGLPRPDLVLFLDISAEEAAKRGGYGDEKYEKKEMQDRVREFFGEVMEGRDGEVFVRVDAGRGLEVVAGEIWGVVRRVLGEERGEVGRVEA